MQSMQQSQVVATVTSGCNSHKWLLYVRKNKLNKNTNTNQRMVCLKTKHLELPRRWRHKSRHLHHVNRPKQMPCVKHVTGNTQRQRWRHALTFVSIRKSLIMSSTLVVLPALASSLPRVHQWLASSVAVILWAGSMSRSFRITDWAEKMAVTCYLGKIVVKWYLVKGANKTVNLG